MKNLIPTVVALIFTTGLFGQINIEDSTVQVIGYWDMNETQSYTITEESIKIEGNDTISRDLSRYEVDITIIDSTKHTYNIEWHYKNYSISSENPIQQKLASLTPDFKITIQTDEFGCFEKVINWKEIRDLMTELINILKADFDTLPGFDTAFDQLISPYKSREAIESSAISEIHQYYAFHGAVYALGEELTAQVQTPNIFGDEPFDCEITVLLDEIFPEDNNYIIRSRQIIDPEQLTDATYNFISQLSSAVEASIPNREDFPTLSNETWSASRIHESGWVIYSIETKKVVAEGTTQINERIIEIL